LAIRIFSRDMAIQKLNYIHNNPVQNHWKLCSTPQEYKYSSALFYQIQEDEFGILIHYLEDL
jgi:putative transposase